MNVTLLTAVFFSFNHLQRCHVPRATLTRSHSFPTTHLSLCGLDALPLLFGPFSFGQNDQSRVLQTLGSTLDVHTVSIRLSSSQASLLPSREGACA